MSGNFTLRINSKLPIKKRIELIANDPQVFFMHKNQKFLPKLTINPREKSYGKLEEHNERIGMTIRTLRS